MEPWQMCPCPQCGYEMCPCWGDQPQQAPAVQDPEDSGECGMCFRTFSRTLSCECGQCGGRPMGSRVRSA
jgi:hypothetical protein